MGLSQPLLLSKQTRYILFFSSKPRLNMDVLFMLFKSDKTASANNTSYPITKNLNMKKNNCDTNFTLTLNVRNVILLPYKV